MTTTQLDDAVDVMLDFFATAAEGKPDDEVVPVAPYVAALAEACGVEAPEVEPMTAGEIRRRVAAGKSRR